MHYQTLSGILQASYFQTDIVLIDRGLIDSSFYGKKFLFIEVLKQINKIDNIDLYILSLAKTTKIKEEKKVWLRKYVSFIKEENWILLNKENGEYNSENRNYIKGEKMKEKLSEYDKVILLDDDHKILKQTNNDIGDMGYVFHISSALI